MQRAAHFHSVDRRSLFPSRRGLTHGTGLLGDAHIRGRLVRTTVHAARRVTSRHRAALASQPAVHRQPFPEHGMGHSSARHQWWKRRHAAKTSSEKIKKNERKNTDSSYGFELCFQYYGFFCFLYLFDCYWVF